MNLQESMQQVANLFNRAVKYQTDAENEQAEELYLKILEFERDIQIPGGDSPEQSRQATMVKTVFSQVHNNIGLFREEEEKYNLAIDCFRTALDYAPGNIEATTNLSRVFLKKRNLDKALEYAKRALNMNPDFGPAIVQFCAVSYELGLPGPALEVLERAEKGRRAGPRFYVEYGRILEKAGRLEEAKEKLARALEMKPDHVYALLNMGNVNFHLSRYQDALENYRAILAVNPQHVEAQASLGKLFQTMGRVEEAVRMYRAALAINPVHRETLGFLSAALEITGQYEESLKMASSLLEMPKLPERAFISANLTKARCERALGRFEDALTTLQSVKTMAKTPNQRNSLYFELGATYDRLKKPGEAFAAFETSNEEFLKRAKPFEANHQDFRNTIQALKDFDLKTLVPATTATKPGAQDSQIVFVFGFLFSGSEALGKLLAGLPDINAHSDSNIMNGLRVSFSKGLGGYPGGLAAIGDKDIDALRQQFFDLYDKFLKGDKPGIPVHLSATNMLDLPLILKLFPKAKIIFTMSHPCDAVLSTFMKDFVPNPATLEFGKLETTTEIFAGYMDLWEKYKAELPFKHLEVRYEELLKNPAKETTKVLKYIGYKNLSGAKKVMAGDDFFNTVELLGSHNPPGRWRRYEAHLEPILETVKPYAEALGYKVNS